jgi:hypothetical protein
MGRDISERVLRGKLAAGRPDISAATSRVALSAREEGHDDVTVALAPAKTSGDCTGKVCEAAVAMLMDAKRSVRVSVSR